VAVEDERGDLAIVLAKPQPVQPQFAVVVVPLTLPERLYE